MASELLMINEKFDGVKKDPLTNKWLIDYIYAKDDCLYIALEGDIHINGNVTADIISVGNTCKNIRIDGLLTCRFIIAMETNIYARDGIQANSSIFSKDIITYKNIKAGNSIVSSGDIIADIVDTTDTCGYKESPHDILCSGRIDAGMLRSKGHIEAKLGIQSRGLIYATGHIESGVDLIAYNSITSESYIDVNGRIFAGVMNGLKNSMQIQCTELKRGTICYGELITLSK